MAKILIADDAAFVRMNMKRMLASSNHELLEAGTGEEAIEIFKKELPDVQNKTKRSPLRNNPKW